MLKSMINYIVARAASVGVISLSLLTGCHALSATYHRQHVIENHDNSSYLQSQTVAPLRLPKGFDNNNIALGQDYAIPVVTATAAPGASAGAPFSLVPPGSSLAVKQ